MDGQADAEEVVDYLQITFQYVYANLFSTTSLAFCSYLKT